MERLRAFTSRSFWHLYLSYVLLVLIAAVPGAILLSRHLGASFKKDAIQALEEKAALFVPVARRLVEQSSPDERALEIAAPPAGNTPPVAEDDTYSTNVDEGQTVAAPGLLDNDSDADGDAITAAPINGGATAEGGTVTLNSDGSFTYATMSIMATAGAVADGDGRRVKTRGATGLGVMVVRAGHSDLREPSRFLAKHVILTCGLSS